MKKLFITALIITTIITSLNKTYAQGCVAIRSNGANCMLAHPGTENDKWQFTTGARYFRSFRHFSGTVENKDRLAQNTEVINHQTAVDLALTRFFNDRFSVMVDVPILANARSSLYEHGLVNGAYVKKERHNMHSFGIGDVRAVVYYWLFDPKKSFRGNIQVGLGIKLPTGQDNYKDYWYNVGPNGSKELRTVDQSIQLGDGGTGFTAEINAFHNFTNKFGIYGNAYYLVNPREQNGVRTYRETLVPALANENIMSVPDQFMARLGFSYSFGKGFTASAGSRIEGIPVHDLVGGSGDFRRPGYVVSVEPSLSYHVSKSNFFVSVPFAVVRKRTQSVTDKENTVKSGKYTRGDAAFADYTINVGYAVKF